MVNGDPDEFVDFMSHYKSMVVIKRMRVLSDTAPENVAFILAGIKNTIYTNKYKFIGIDTDLLADTAKTVCMGIRKTVNSISELDKILNDNSVKDSIKKACENDSLHVDAVTYLIYEILKNINTPSSVTQLQLSKMYKNLKLPKARKGKKRK